MKNKEITELYNDYEFFSLQRYIFTIRFALKLKRYKYIVYKRVKYIKWNGIQCCLLCIF